MSIIDKITGASKKAAEKVGKKTGRANGSKDAVEKKVVHKAKDPSGLDNLLDFSDIESMMKDSKDLGLAAAAAAPQVDVSGFETRVAAVEDKLVQMDGSIKSTRSSVKSMDERLADMEQNILKLLSIYEIVKRDMNPFIGPKGATQEKVDPAFLGIEGAELIKTPDVVDDLDDIDFGTDALLSKEPGAGKMAQEPTVDLPDFDEVEEVPPPKPPAPQPPRETPYPETGGFDMRETKETFSPPRELPPPETFGIRGSPILNEINYDYRTVILVMRWIEFMFERVTRDRISALLDYYKDVGWVSERVKSQIMAYARGEVQNILKFEPEEEPMDEVLGSPKQPTDYKKVSDWRLSADDHLKSLLFVTKIANIQVNKDTFNSLEEDIKIFTRDLESYHGV